MEQENRVIGIYFNSPTKVEMPQDITWGTLKAKLIATNFPKNIQGIDNDTLINYKDDDQMLPNGDLDLSIIVTKTEYGI